MSSTELPPKIPVPAVIPWFKAYCWVLSAMYLVVMAASLPFFFVDPQELEMQKVGAVMIGLGLLLLGTVLLGASLLPLFLPQKPWLWTYDLILICLGLTSPCFLLFCIPLLIFWLKPETKSFFGAK